MTITRAEAEERMWEASDWRIEQAELDRMLSWVGKDGSLTVPASSGTQDEIQQAYDRGYQAGLRDAEPLPAGPVPLPDGVTPGRVCKGPDDAVWLYLGVPVDLGTSAPAVGSRAPARRGRPPHPVGSTRVCSKCQVVRPFPSGFHPRGDGGYRGACKECENARRRAGRSKGKGAG